MKVLVTGASSLPGYRICEELLADGFEVVGMYKNNPISIANRAFKSVKMDIRDYGGIRKILENVDIVVHAAALGDVDQCEREKETAWELNSRATARISSLASRYSKHLIYISTDYVFDGSRGGYKESDPPNPVNYYGLTKLIGEMACLGSGARCAIVRGSSIFGLGPGRENFAKFLIRRLENGERVNALVDQYTSPSQARILAKAVGEIVQNEMEGIFHVVSERISRFDFACKIADALGLDRSLIDPVRMDQMKWYAKRPVDSSLDSSQTRKYLKVDMSLSESLRLLKEEYQER